MEDKKINVLELIKEGKESLSEEEKDLLMYYGDYNSGYICDIISEISDNQVDIYNYDLWEFAKNNENWIREAVLEFGIDTENFDLIRLFQSGEYLYYSQLFYDNLEELTKIRCYYYIMQVLEIEEITADQLEELDFLNYDDNNEQLENLFSQIDDIFEEES